MHLDAGCPGILGAMDRMLGAAVQLDFALFWILEMNEVARYLEFLDGRKKKIKIKILITTPGRPAGQDSLRSCDSSETQIGRGFLWMGSGWYWMRMMKDAHV